MHRVYLLQPVMQTLMGLRFLLYTHVGNIHLIDMKDRESYKNREFTKSLYGQDFDSKDEGVTLLESGDVVIMDSPFPDTWASTHMLE